MCLVTLSGIIDRKKNSEGTMVKKQQEPAGLQELIDQILLQAVLPKECAEIMQMTVDNVRNYCRRGRFEGAVQFGNEWLIPRSTVEQYLKTSRGKPGRRTADEVEP
jgi:hypothetical protein